MIEKQWYKVGGYSFCITVDSIPNLLETLTNCHPFRISEEEAKSTDETIFNLAIKESIQKPIFTGKFIVQFEGEEIYLDLYESTNGEQIFAISMQKRSIALLKLEQNSPKASLILAAGLNHQQQIFAINNTLMLLYAIHTACKNALLIHASVIACKNHGYVFLGKSGTGKSTHSQLWLQHIEQSYLLNDDNPVIRLHDNEVIVYGTPWSGKTPCYRNESMPLGGIVRLSQYPENKIERLTGAAAYAAIAPSASAIRWKQEYAEGLHSTLSKIVSHIGIYHLQCRPDKEAALLCYETISK